MIDSITWREFLDPILLSLKVAAVSSVFVLLLGGLAAWRMSRTLAARPEAPRA